MNSLRLEAELAAAAWGISELMDSNLDFYREAYEGPAEGAAWFFVEGMISSLEDALDEGGGREVFLATLKEYADEYYQFLVSSVNILGAQND